MITQVTSKAPNQCTSLDDARHEIDAIDQHIIKLLAHRHEYVKMVAQFKEATLSAIQADDRRQQVLECRRQWAKEQGLDPDVIAQMWDMMIAYFIREELKIKKI